MTYDELKRITQQREKRTIEYKEAWSELPGNLFETVCAFLNRDGGVIVLGAHDDGSITDGVNPRAIDQMCKNIANISNNAEMLKPSFLLQPEIVEFDDTLTGNKTQVIVVKVPSSSQAHRFKNKYYDRSVDGDYELRTDAQISILYLRKSAEHTEDRVYPYLRVEDLREETIEIARNRMSIVRSNHPWLDLSLMDMLKQANLYRRDPATNQEGLTLGALMLFGKQEVIQSALPYYRIDAVLRVRNVDRYDDRLQLFGNIIDSYFELLNFTEKHLPDPFYMEGDMRISLRDKVFREIFANMIAHREYLNPYETIFDITREGIFAKNANRPLKAGPVTLENYERHPKNPHIANFLIQIGIGEHLGSGIRNLYHYAPLYTGKDPIIDDEDVYIVKLALPRDMNIGQDGTPVTDSITDSITNSDTDSNTNLDTSTKDKSLKISELSDKQKAIISFCSKPKSAKEILEHIEVSYQTKNIKRHINVLVGNGFLEMTNPENPNASNQKYVRVKRARK